MQQQYLIISLDGSHPPFTTDYFDNEKIPVYPSMVIDITNGQYIADVIYSDDATTEKIVWADIEQDHL